MQRLGLGDDGSRQVDAEIAEDKAILQLHVVGIAAAQLEHVLARPELGQHDLVERAIQIPAHDRVVHRLAVEGDVELRRALDQQIDRVSGISSTSNAKLERQRRPVVAMGLDGPLVALGQPIVVVLPHPQRLAHALCARQTSISSDQASSCSAVRHMSSVRTLGSVRVKGAARTQERPFGRVPLRRGTGACQRARAPAHRLALTDRSHR